MVEKTNKLTIAQVIFPDKKNRTKSPSDKSEPIVYNNYNVKPLLDKFSKEIDQWYNNQILKNELPYSLPGTKDVSYRQETETNFSNNTINQTPFPAVAQNISINNSNSQETVYYTSNVNRSVEANSTGPSVGISGSNSETVSDDKEENKTENRIGAEVE